MSPVKLGAWERLELCLDGLDFWLDVKPKKKASHKPTSQRKNMFYISPWDAFWVDFCAVDYHPLDLQTWTLKSWQGLCEMEAMVHVLCRRPFDQDSGLWIYLIHSNRRSNIQRFQTQKNYILYGKSLPELIQT